MASETAGAARPRPKPTDLDLIAPDRTRLVLKPVRAPRFVLHLMDSPVDHRGPQRSLAPVLKALDLQPSDHSAVMHLPQWLMMALPRGVPWTDYPIVAAPAYTVRVSNPVPVYLPNVPLPRSCPIDKLAERVDTVAVHLPSGWDGAPRDAPSPTSEILVMAGRLIDSLSPGVTVALVRGSHVLGGIAELRSLIEAHEPALRFRYSYEANFRAIAAPALEHALAKPDPKALAFTQSVTFYGNGLPGYPVDLLIKVRRRHLRPYLRHPFALQVLYDLRHRGKAPLATQPTKLSDALWASDLVFGRGEHVWKGTGKHDPVAWPDDLARRIAVALAETMLLRRDRKSIRLSDTGEAFLDAIHPDCMDLDLPMRWSSHPSTTEDKESMDAWIARRFRRMKTRVNALGKETPKVGGDDEA